MKGIMSTSDLPVIEPGEIYTQEGVEKPTINLRGFKNGLIIALILWVAFAFVSFYLWKIIF